jgi:hypothetical protein
VRRRVDEARDQLRAQEEQIARLARDDLSNPGSARSSSPARTVEWHLHELFTSSASALVGASRGPVRG